MVFDMSILCNYSRMLIKLPATYINSHFAPLPFPLFFLHAFLSYSDTNRYICTTMYSKHSSVQDCVFHENIGEIGTPQVVPAERGWFHGTKKWGQQL